MRYLSHFRSVHRGAVFTEIRTTSVRKLTPESWGFLCPVHTPDGGLCGLLNHLSFMCEVWKQKNKTNKTHNSHLIQFPLNQTHLFTCCHKICTDEPSTDKLVELLGSLGMLPLESGLFKFKGDSSSLSAAAAAASQESGKKSSKGGGFFYEILVNGRLVGYVAASEVESMKAKLRYLKALATLQSSKPSSAAGAELNGQDSESIESQAARDLPTHMEICHVPRIELENCTYGLYPGVYIFTTPGRMMRPIRNLQTSHVEYVGTMEQCYLHVCVKPEEFIEGVCVVELFSFDL